MQNTLDFNNLSYEEVLDLIEENFYRILEHLDKKDLSRYLPYTKFKEKIYHALNPKTYSLKNLLSPRVKIVYGYIYENYSNENTKDNMFKINVLFSPHAQFRKDPRYLADYSDYLISNMLDLNVSTYGIHDLKLRKKFINLFDEEEDPKYYQIPFDGFNKDKIIYVNSCFTNLNLTPKIMGKMLFVPILINQQISKEIMVLPFEFYPSDLQKFINENENSKITFLVKE